MILLWISIGPVETCVLLLIAAAAVVALSVRPTAAVPPEEFYYAGSLVIYDGEEPPTPELLVETHDGVTEWTRYGFDRQPPAGIEAVSIALTLRGADVTIEERIVADRASSITDSTVCARFRPDCFVAGRTYRVRYNSSALSRSVTFTFVAGSSMPFRLPLRH
ncbi:MAG TPA: hypothetical protein PK430_02235 [Muribaculum sp.]|jgi:hypothetical protein|uniref:Uncharacterized protein n=1 Tax=Heminiphilus faecis TaxID=2601703 RepID=A0ABV4CWF2_9BACT|nr:hypothetical protein [Heminiphilus faecis]RLT77898.1 hypothetical protein D7V95_01270 [bacterium J10(2018)]HRF68021.1 hypothetical protein [Muribaculum sp.]